MSATGDRALARDVFIYDFQDSDTLLGGLVLNVGSDIMGDIRYDPKAAERMEFELFSRFPQHIDIYSEEKQAGVDTDEENEQGGNFSDKG
ncbi:hypothetical protein B0T25DRAFT_566984 [Lasiosphaeria hispida]|uniref:Uncharacterized protein n=1 Tax=Lasiosphaeria hispida TaxID=260671 RepID=A0AAJ0HN89_9PEZI|nr:hypothetical protein B0T25DRAFT_566984 [Lasiosphaeria hispida]